MYVELKEPKVELNVFQKSNHKEVTGFNLAPKACNRRQGRITQNKTNPAKKLTLMMLPKHFEGLSLNFLV